VLNSVLKITSSIVSAIISSIVSPTLTFYCIHFVFAMVSFNDDDNAMPKNATLRPAIVGRLERDYERRNKLARELYSGILDENIDAWGRDTVLYRHEVQYQLEL